METSQSVIQVAICDDEKIICTEIERMLMDLSYMLNFKVTIEHWYSGERLCDYLAKGNSLDIIFLDIELTRLSGIDVGHYIRDVLEDMKTQVVYISSKRNYALQLFKTQPFDFLIKPITIDILCNLMKKILKILKSQNHLFEYRVGRELCRIPYDDVLYFKSDLHKVKILLLHREIEYYGKIKDIVDIAPVQYIRIHKSYLINNNYVKRYAFEYVEMKNNDILSISKAYQKSVRKRISFLIKEKVE